MKAFAKYGFVLALVVLLGAGVSYFVKENLMNIEKVQVELSTDSKERLLFEGIHKDLLKQLQTIEGLPLYEISLNQIMQMVTDDKRVERASVRRTFPNKIVVSIKPRKPLLLLLGLEGEFHPIANDASLLPSMSIGVSPDLPILRGLQFFESESDRMKIVKVLEQIPKQGEFSRKNISEIRMNKAKEVTLFLSQSGQRVLIGDDLDKGQVFRVEQVLKYLQSRSIKGRVIDARFSKKVVVRVRNAS